MELEWYLFSWSEAERKIGSRASRGQERTRSSTRAGYIIASFIPQAAG